LARNARNLPRIGKIVEAIVLIIPGIGVVSNNGSESGHDVFSDLTGQTDMRCCHLKSSDLASMFSFSLGTLTGVACLILLAAVSGLLESSNYWIVGFLLTSWLAAQMPIALELLRLSRFGRR
jgi:hypothetical protein